MIKDLIKNQFVCSNDYRNSTHAGEIFRRTRGDGSIHEMVDLKQNPTHSLHRARVPLLVLAELRARGRRKPVHTSIFADGFRIIAPRAGLSGVIR